MRFLFSNFNSILHVKLDFFFIILGCDSDYDLKYFLFNNILFFKIIFKINILK